MPKLTLTAVSGIHTFDDAGLVKPISTRVGDGDKVFYVTSEVYLRIKQYLDAAHAAGSLNYSAVVNDPTQDAPEAVEANLPNDAAERFQIEGIPVSSNVTAANLSELTGGGVSSLHTHQRGIIAGSRIAFSADPANADTITIGGHVFKFLTVLLAAQTYTQITRGGGAAATLASLLNAINGVVDATVVQASTPFAGSIVADAPTATSLRIRNATARGGSAKAGVPPSTALLASITGGASAWPVANLTDAGGKAATDQLLSKGRIPVTSAMITALSLNIELPFAPSSFLLKVRTSAGAEKAVVDVAVIADTSIALTLSGAGGATHINATDTVDFEAIN
jgi:hypothetical protein